MHQSIQLITPVQLLACAGQYLLLDARPAAEYTSGHIPGARSINWEVWCASAPEYARAELKQPGYWGVLQEATAYGVAERLAALGLENAQPVVVYADGPRSKGREGRVAWMLLYWGASRVYLLDGGWSAWLAAEGPSEQQPARSEPGTFTIELHEERRIRLDELKLVYASQHQPLLIDVRPRAEFIGEQHTYQPRLGHIPGALHWPLTSIFEQDGGFINRTAYLQLLARLVGERTDLITYCEVGVRACTLALLHEIYTGQVIRCFDGSMMAWGLDETLAVAR